MGAVGDGGAVGRSGRGGLAAVAAGVCALCAAAVILDAPLAVRVSSGAAFLLLGAPLLGPLTWATPVEPSPVKLATMSALLTLPALALAGFLAARLGTGATGAALVAAAGVPASLLALTRRLHFQRPGGAQVLALALAAVAAVGGAALLVADAGLTLRASSPETVTHAGLAGAASTSALGASASATGSLVEQPWLVGGAVRLRLATAFAVAAAADLLRVGPLLACGALSALAWGVAVVLSYLASAAAGRDVDRPGAGVRDLVGAAAAPAAAGLCLGRGLVDPGAALGVVLAAGAAYAALHGARSGARPWPGLAVLLVASAGVFAPSLGVAGAALAAAQLFAGGRRSSAVVAALALAPGAILARPIGHATLAVDGSAEADVRALAALGVLVAAPWLLAVLHRRLPRTSFLAALGALVAVPLGFAGARAAGARAAYASATPAIVEESGALRVRATTARLGALRRALDAVRTDAAEPAHAPAAVVRWAAEPEDARSRPPALTPLLTGVPLFWAPPPPPGSTDGAPTALGDDRARRGAFVRALLGERSAWSPRYRATARAVAERGLVLYFVVTEADRVRTSGHSDDRRGPDLVLERLGAEVIHRGEDGEEVWRLR
ncbi:MAG: hypothetical protein AAFZ87_06940 [Planctomycetota bacterium]